MWLFGICTMRARVKTAGSLRDFEFLHILETPLVYFIMRYGSLVGRRPRRVAQRQIWQVAVFTRHYRLPELLSRQLEVYMQELESSFLGGALNLTLAIA